MTHDLANPVRNHRGGDKTGKAEAHGVDPPTDIEADDIWKPLVERRHRVPEIRLSTADAGVTAADRPIGTFVPLHHRTVLRGRRSFAAHLVEAMALPVRFVAPRFHILPGVKMSAPFAIVVNGLTISEQRASEPVERRPALQGHVIDDKRGKILR